MNEGEKILKDIKALLITFVIAFAIYAGLFIGFNLRILTDLRAVSQCIEVEDSEFKACYESKR